MKSIKKNNRSKSIKPSSSDKFDDMDKLIMDISIETLLNRLPFEIRKFDLRASLGNLYYKNQIGRIIFIYKAFPNMVITPKMVEYVRLINHIKSVVGNYEN